MTTGQLGTLKDPQLYWAEGEIKEVAGMRMVQASGPRMPIVAARCAECGHVELSAQE